MRALLVLRGIVGLWFGVRIAVSAEASWNQTFDLVVDYLLIDGVLALGVSGFLLREGMIGNAIRERTLSAIVLIDGMGRIGSAIAVHVWPGIPGFPVTAVIFLGVMAVCTTAVGMTEATLTVREEIARHGRQHSRPQFQAGPVAVASITSIVFGVAALLAVGDRRLLQVLLGAYIVSASGVMFAMAWSRRRAAHRLVTFR